MIYDNISALAKSKNITIQKIEQECGLSGGLIGKWRENNNPKIDNLKKVAEYFGVSIEELIKEAT